LVGAWRQPDKFECLNLGPNKTSSKHQSMSD
jgi:hypothetical protein